ncbi:MAG: hypothetical protein WKG03_21340 [Telluria sp.]
MRNEAIPVGVPTSLYAELCCALRRSNDTRHPDELIALAIRTFLANQFSKPQARGYQWKNLFLPEGTDLRMRYMGTWYHAKIEGDALMYGGESMSPREWTLYVTGSIRNAWRDIWIRRNVTEGWTRALMWREQYCRKRPGEERRSVSRRASD